MAGLGVTLNGEERQLPEGLTVSGLLQHLDLADKPCAVEINRSIVPRSTQPRHELRPGDQIEIVSFVGGG
jgi:thiamine biosynthesis protein ThiS